MVRGCGEGLVMVARRRVGGVERWMVGEEREREMQMVGGVGREVMTEKSRWVGLGAISCDGSEGGKVMVEVGMSRAP